MKYLSMLVVLAAVYALNGCSSDGGFTTSSSTGEKVPGEVKSAEEGRLQPGAGAGPSATMKW